MSPTLDETNDILAALISRRIVQASVDDVLGPKQIILTLDDGSMLIAIARWDPHMRLESLDLTVKTQNEDISLLRFLAVTGLTPGDTTIIAYALRYLADDSDDHRPKMAERMRDIATHIERKTKR
jgi:hypothetical protein